MNNHLSRRGLLGLGLGAGSAALLAACGDSGPSDKVTGGQNAGPAAASYSGPNVTLAFWNGFTGGDGPFMKKLVDQFNTEHPNIKVTMNVYQWADYYQKVPAAVATGNGPDLGIMHVDHVATNAARGVILQLDDLAKTLNLTEGDFSPPVWASSGSLASAMRSRSAIAPASPPAPAASPRCERPSIWPAR